MASLHVDTQRVDPYRHFAFRVKWEGRHVAGVSRVVGLQRSMARPGERGDRALAATATWPQRSPLQAITLERGVTHDRAFAAWAEQGARCGSGALADTLRTDVVIEVYDAAGLLILACTVRRCRVALYQALPDLDGSAGGVAIERLLLEHARLPGDVAVPGAAGRGLA